MTFDGLACDDALKNLGMTEPVVVNAVENGELENVFDKMVTSQRTDILYCGYTCSGLVYDYILEFRRFMETELASTRSRKLSMLLPMLQYMHSHFNEDFALSQLAAMLDITPQHYCRLFRESLNMKPGDYLLGLRMTEAKRLIRESRLPLSEIATLCGFNDASYFSTVFKKKEGVSPAVYRKGTPKND